MIKIVLEDQNAMTKKKLIQLMVEEYHKNNINTSITEMTKMVNNFFQIMHNNFVEKNEIELRELGCFKVKQRKERIIVNPKLKKKYFIEARSQYVFRPSKKIKEQLNIEK